MSKSTLLDNMLKAIEDTKELNDNVEKSFNKLKKGTGKVKLLRKEVVSNGIGTMKDHVVDYIFTNTCSYDELVKAVQKLSGYKTVEKGQEEWLECTHELIRVTEDEVVIRFTKPYCD